MQQLNCSTLLMCGALMLVPLASQGGETTRVSLSSSGEQGNARSSVLLTTSAVSNDGRYVAFLSDATNLVAGGTNGHRQVYVRDNQTGTVDVILSPNGAQFTNGPKRPTISDDGRYVAFSHPSVSTASWTSKIYVYDRDTKTTEVITDSSGVEFYAEHPNISGNGRFVTFITGASLVNEDTNGFGDVYIYDRQTAAMERVSVSTTGGQSNNNSFDPVVSSDGRYVAFRSYATNLVTEVIMATHVYVRDRLLGTTVLVSKHTNGTQGNLESGVSDISSDGRYVVFHTKSTTLGGTIDSVYDVFVHDLFTGTTQQISIGLNGASGDGDSHTASISADGRYIAYHSWANNLVNGDSNGLPDVFVFDRNTGTTSQVSVSSAGNGGNYGSLSPSISPDGRYVVFESGADNLVPGDTNAVNDVFLHDRLPASCM